MILCLFFFKKEIVFFSLRLSSTTPRSLTVFLKIISRVSLKIMFNPLHWRILKIMLLDKISPKLKILELLFGVSSFNLKRESKISSSSLIRAFKKLFISLCFATGIK